MSLKMVLLWGVCKFLIMIYPNVLSILYGFCHIPHLFLKWQLFNACDKRIPYRMCFMSSVRIKLSSTAIIQCLLLHDKFTHFNTVYDAV